MLKNLYISSFVIIDQLQIDFYDGMSVLTGETGAGKSIIIDALGQLSGNRASVSLVKKGCDKAVIEGIFDIAINNRIEQIFENLHIEIDDQLVITKEIYATGKSNIKINYQNSSNNALKILAPYLIDIHSQFETQKLFEESNHILLLNQYANQEINPLLHNYQQEYKKYKDISLQYKNALEEDLSDENLEYLQSQLDEIEEINYTDEDVEALEEELKLLENYEKINEQIHSFDQLMNSSNGALNQIKESLHCIQMIQDYNDFNDSYEKMYDLYYDMIDEYENIMNAYYQFHFDEYRFNELQDILYQINRLKRKYGYTMSKIQEYREELIEKIDTINHREEYLDKLNKEKKLAYDRCYKIAQDLHKVRKNKAILFEKDIMKELKDLYLDKAIFKIEFHKVEIQPQGIDKVRLMIAVNKGQELSPLTESASGGEISRIMLAIKTIILAYGDIDTIIFDEVDTGVSGKIATSIGQKMLHLSQKKQVICISHLPQVASLAQHQYSIEKRTNNDDTVSSIRLLNQEERVFEIAKMLSSEKVTDEAIENAKQLLNV